MQISMSTTGNFDKTTLWLRKMQTRTPVSRMNRIGENVKSALEAATPKRTGETASGWRYRVEKTKHGYQLYWFNIAHPETEANVAKLINYGHGTKNGGYVQPNPFIAPAVNGLIAAGARELGKEMVK